jgi:hypothetical protein
MDPAKWDYGEAEGILCPCHIIRNNRNTVEEYHQAHSDGVADAYARFLPDGDL